MARKREDVSGEYGSGPERHAKSGAPLPPAEDDWGPDLLGALRESYT